MVMVMAMEFYSSNLDVVVVVVVVRRGGGNNGCTTDLPHASMGCLSWRLSTPSTDGVDPRMELNIFNCHHGQDFSNLSRRTELIAGTLLNQERAFGCTIYHTNFEPHELG